MTYEELLAENLRLRERILELEQENARLKGYGSSLLCEPEPPQYGSGRMQPERNRDAEIQRRLNIFRALFRGRDDVFAQRFVSKAGKAGYQPVCKNRWSPECTEHKRKCEGCPFREFIPLDETAIRRHLDKDAKEKDVIGIYPILADMLAPFCRNVVQLIGTASAKEKRLAMGRLKSIPETEPLIVIATGKYVGEGFNYPRLDTLFIALPVAYPNIVQQYTGRLHRDYEGKTEVRVYDYIDIHVPVIANMYGKRLKCYAPIGYARQMADALEPNPQNIVLAPDAFLPVLVSDIETARSSVVLSCESVQYMKGTMARALQSLGVRGVECCIIIRKPSSRDEDFIRAGIKLVETERQPIRAAVIDRSLLWFGSIDLAGSHHKEEDNVMRVLAPVIASEMMGYILGES